MQKHLLLSAMMLLLYGHSLAQNPTVVFSQNKCDYGKLEGLREKTKSVSAPILNELVQEGKLINWGILEHSWGDEWNWNIYYAAKDIPTFLDAFNTFVSEASKADSQFVSEIWNSCFEHKDAMYTESMGYNSTGSGPTLKSMTMFNVPDGYSGEQIKASIAMANKAIAGLGYLGNGYAFYMVKDESVKTQQCLVEGTWLSQEVYDKIHASDEWKDATGRDQEMWDKIMADRMYRRYHKQ
ncbi:MAG: hypothetical protein HKN87_04155 [Saprospiraceae bacterium]|nr:hypothetical protein [Saprospiraceae bacterium]